MPGEADFVADLGFSGVQPGVSRIGEHFAIKKGFNAAGFEKWDLFGVAQFGVGFVLDQGLFSFDRYVVETVDGIGFSSFVDFGNDRLSRFFAPTNSANEVLFFGGSDVGPVAV